MTADGEPEEDEGEDGTGDEEVDGSVRVWLVERTYSDDEPP